MSTVKKQGLQTMCKHLRSKEMYHSDQPQREDLYHSGIFWCDVTADGLGPDRSCADSEECMIGRGCFER